MANHAGVRKNVTPGALFGNTVDDLHSKGLTFPRAMYTLEMSNDVTFDNKSPSNVNLGRRNYAAAVVFTSCPRSKPVRWNFGTVAG